MNMINNLKSFASKIKNEVKVIYVAWKFKKIPLVAKISAGLTIAYALSPIDLIPDFIPVLGYVDDLIILPLLILLTMKLIPIKVIAESRKDAEFLWREGWPKNWKYGLLILGLWIIILIYIFVKVSN